MLSLSTILALILALFCILPFLCAAVLSRLSEDQILKGCRRVTSAPVLRLSLATAGVALLTATTPLQVDEVEDKIALTIERDQIVVSFNHEKVSYQCDSNKLVIRFDRSAEKVLLDRRWNHKMIYISDSIILRNNCTQFAHN